LRMIWKRLLSVVFVAIIGGLVRPASAADLKITLPRRSELTPVQHLNREGVEAVRRHRYNAAQNFFYKAYLYDPGDPFTLNNLGYVSELQGDLERAQAFYALATAQASDAVIDLANSARLQGKPMRNALSGLQDVTMQVNQANVQAISLLAKKRPFEAEDLLRQTLALSPQNPFTLNNLGVALEAEGDFDAATRYYAQTAQLHSAELVIVTLDSSSRGKPISEVAAESEKRLRQRMQSEQTAEIRSAQLNLRGVTAVNRNDWLEAAQDFRQAYKINPYSAFSLNNIGYVSEKDGDPETAQFFYEKAQSAPDANAPISFATRRSAEGMKLAAVANESDQKVEKTLAEEMEIKRQETAPIQLKRRDGKPIEGSDENRPTASPEETSPNPAVPPVPRPPEP